MQRTDTALIEARQIALRFPGDSRPLFANLDMTLTKSRHALIGRNGIGKSCLAALLAGRMTPSEGSVRRGCTVGYLSQNEASLPGTGADVLGISVLRNAGKRILAGGGTPEDFGCMEGQWNWETEIEALLDEGKLSVAVLDRAFSSLSGGEQTRLRLLALKRQGYGFIILDEPSNHLDRAGRIWLADQLARFAGGSLLVSHDPYVLERTPSIYELDGSGLSHSRGGWKTWLESREQGRLGAQREAELAKKQLQQAQRDRQQAHEKAEQRQSKGNAQRSNANQSKIILDRQLGRSEATRARHARLHDARLQHAAGDALAAMKKLEIVAPLAIVPAEPEQAANPVLHLKDVVLPFNCTKPLSLILNNSDRLAVTGRNGSGKSTLLQVAGGMLPPAKGQCATTRSRRLMDQHFSFLDKDVSALHNFQHQAPGWTESLYRTRLAQLRMRGEDALKPVSMLSGGEQLKVALACLFCGPSAPALLILDEPDNHLDVESRELLQQALRDYKGAVALVSHDDAFIESVGAMRRLSLD